MKTAFFTVLGLAAGYGLCGFVAWNIDASAWSMDGRFFALLPIGFGGLVGWAIGTGGY
jgi:hypothetical protein